MCARQRRDWSESRKISVFYPLMSPDGGAFRNLPTAKWSKRYFPVKSSYLQQNSQMGDKSLWVLLSYLWSGNLIIIIFQLFSFKFWLLCFSIMWNWLDLLIAVLARPNILFQLFSENRADPVTLCRDPNICFELLIAELLMRDSSLSQFCQLFAQALLLIFIETGNKGTFLGCRVRWRNAESKFCDNLWTGNVVQRSITFVRFSVLDRPTQLILIWISICWQLQIQIQTNTKDIAGQSHLWVFRTLNLWKRGLYEAESSPDMKLIVLSSTSANKEIEPKLVGTDLKPKSLLNWNFPQVDDNLGKIDGFLTSDFLNEQIWRLFNSADELVHNWCLPN